MTAHITAIWLGHDPGEGENGTDLMFTLFSDGTAELAHRAGRDARWVTWSPPVAMAGDARMPEARHG